MSKPNLQFEIEKAWRLATSPLRPLPSFVIGGAPKCGTSTLYDYLVTLPGVRRGARKEPTNFLHYPGSRLRAAMNYPIRWPGTHFIVGDGSVEYFTDPRGPANVKEIIPSARLIFLMRDPVARAWSDYQMFRKFGSDRADFSETVRAAMRWLDDPATLPLVDAAARHAHHPTRYVLCGWYARALDRWLSVFPREQCLFLFNEELFSDPATHFPKVFAHLGLKVDGVAPMARARDGKYADAMPPETESALRKFFEPRNRELASLLGRDLPWV